ncbi:MAG TPA: hypothetical protein DCS93_27775 [Microscillaceae bacterium]|nr:hypothetical protein [Microscillaceae bacterium]
MKGALRIFAIILVFTFPLTAQSLFQEIKFSNINSTQGLSQNTVKCMVQDRKGFLWFGTADGLNRYDGYQFKIYRNELGNKNSLSNNYITALLEDKTGYIWIGTLGGGVNRFDPLTETFTRFRPHKDKVKGVAGDEINAFVEDEDGKIWIATNKKALSYFDPRHQKIVYIRESYQFPIPSRYVYSIITDQNKGLWLGTRWGVAYFDKKLQTCTWRLSVNPNPTKFFYDDAVYHIVRDQVNPRFLWLCTFEAGLIKFDTHSRKIVAKWGTNATQKNSLKAKSVWGFLQDHRGNYWVGTANGFYKFDPQNNHFTLFAPDPQNPQSIAGSNIQQVFEDKAGTIWLCSFKNGTSAFTPALNNFHHYKPNKSTSPQVTSFCEDNQGNIWFGTKGGAIGLTKLHRKTGEVITFKNTGNNPRSIATNNINTLLKDVDGSIWIGTIGGGLDHYDPKTGIFEHLPYNTQSHPSLRLHSPHIGAIFQDPQVPGELWIGTRGGGVVKYDKRKKKVTKSYLFRDSFNGTSLSQGTVIAITKDYKGNLWIATRKGLNRFDPHQEIFTNYFHSPTNKYSLSSDYVTALYIDKQQVLWIGTRNGLNKLNLKEVYKGNTQFQHYTIKQGLPNNVIHKIIEDTKGFLWLSTSKGLSCFDKKEEKFRNYDEQDGLQGNEFLTGSGLLTKDGVVLMGGTNGFNLFEPEKVNKNTYKPPVKFTDFQLFNKSVSVDKKGVLPQPIWNTDTLELSYKDKVLSFEFAALNYILPDKNTYAVFMEGFDQEWSYIGKRRFISYTALSPGTYILRVKAANNDGVWSDKEAQVVIIVHPAWWQTWWFRGSVALLALLVLTGLYFLRKYIIRIYEKRTKAVVIQHTTPLKKTNEALQKTLRELQAKEDRLISKAKKPTRSIFKDKAEIEYLKQKLSDVIIRQELYKDEDISLAKVAQKMETTDRKLSELMNKELNTNFYDYLNGCRVNVFKERVVKGDARRITLLAIAYESGFQSKATFNRIFKKQTGLTPSQFKKKVDNTLK